MPEPGLRPSGTFSLEVNTMRSAERLQSTPVRHPGETAPDGLNPAGEAKVNPLSVSGLAPGIDLENYRTDLQDLAYLVYRYLELQERAESEDEPEVTHLLQRITRSVKHLATIYTDCLSEFHQQFQKTQPEANHQLKEFPQAIAQVQRQLLKTDQQLRQLSESVAILTAAIERQIAFDPTLKNDAQRKARRTELMESDRDYIAAANALKSVQDRRETLLIELQFLRNQFSVLKLDVRAAIATKELAVFDAA